MMIMCLQDDGTYIPDPDFYPTDLVVVVTVYGRKCRVRRAHLDGERVMLPCFTPRRVHYVDTPGNFHKRYVPRENLKP